MQRDLFVYFDRVKIVSLISFMFRLRESQPPDWGFWLRTRGSAVSRKGRGCSIELPFDLVRMAVLMAGVACAT